LYSAHPQKSQNNAKTHQLLHAITLPFAVQLSA
jgi:hypothetical protein